MEHVRSDLTIIGAGIAGICAALAAARHGLSVSLVNDRPVPGGNASSEVGVGILGAASHGRSLSVYARETGIVEEIKLTTIAYNDGSNQLGAMSDAALLDLIYGEKYISLFLNTIVHEADVSENAVRAVRGIQHNSERKFQFESPLFIDSSGDGTVAYKSGALSMWGRESKMKYNESLAPEKADNYVLGDTILFYSRERNYPVSYRRPAFAYDITQMDFFNNIGKFGLHRDIYRYGKEFRGFWWLEYGGELDTVTDNEEIVLELRKLVYGIWDYIKNSGDFDDVENLELDRVCHIPGKRESRRFVGDYVLTQNDIEKKPEFHDAVSIGGWPMDVHAPKGIYDDLPATNWFPVQGIYNIPFRCLYSKNISNLMLAGRDISTSHVAFGSTRVIGTCGCTGQAVGTAAVLCNKYKKTPREVQENHASELQGMLLRDDQTILGLKEQIPEEIKNEITISASSQRKYQLPLVNAFLDLSGRDQRQFEMQKGLSLANNEKSADIECNYCLALPLSSDYAEAVEIFVQNTSGQNKQLQVDIFGGERPENYFPKTYVKTLTVNVGSGHDGWIEVPLDCRRSLDGKIYLVFKNKKGLFLGSTTERLTGVVSFRYFPDQPLSTDTGLVHLLKMEHTICFRGLKPVQNVYGAEQVISGYSRPYGLPNLWISEDSRKSGEQWLKLHFKNAVVLEEVHFVFNTMLEEDIPVPSIPELIKNYTLIIRDESGNDHRQEITGNYVRVRKHKVLLDTVKEILFKPSSTYGSYCYELFAVKLFGGKQENDCGN
jgi:hypothetical protein